MKYAISAFLTLFLFSLNAQEKINVKDAKKYLDKYVEVCAKVEETHVNKSSTVYNLNLGAKYPNQDLTIVIFKKDLQNFSYKPEYFLKDKNICVDGTISEYEGRIQIKVHHEKRIRIQE